MKTHLLKHILIALPLMGVVNLFSFEAKAQFASGDGSIASPYVIETPEQLNAVRNNATSYFELGANIDMTEWLHTNSPDLGWVPIKTFSGTIDGLGFFINGLWINTPDSTNVGLIGAASGATILSLGINLDETIGIVGKDNVGGLVGLVNSTLTIENCCLNGNIAGTTTVGGLVGGLNAKTLTIKNSYTTGDITSTAGNAGGILGLCYGKATVRIEKTYALGAILGPNAGGLVGSHSYTTSNPPVSASMILTNCVAANSSVRGTNARRVIGSSKNKALVGLVKVLAFDEMTVNDTLAISSNDTILNGFNTNKDELKLAATYSTWDLENIWQLGNSLYPLPVIKYNDLDLQIKTSPAHLAGAPASTISVKAQKSADIYYNQSTGELVIKNKRNNSKVFVFDSTGRAVLNTQESVIELASLPKGIYFVKADGKTAKFLKF